VLVEKIGRRPLKRLETGNYVLKSNKFGFNRACNGNGRRRSVRVRDEDGAVDELAD